MDVLNTEVGKYKRCTKRQIILLCALILFTVAVNILLCVFKTESTSTAFLILNIAIDILTFWFCAFYIITVIRPRRRFAELSDRGQKYAVESCGKVLQVSDGTICVQGFNCFEITVETDDVRKAFVIENSGIAFDTGKEYKLFTVDNIVVSAEVIE